MPCIILPHKIAATEHWLTRWSDYPPSGINYCAIGDHLLLGFLLFLLGWAEFGFPITRQDRELFLGQSRRPGELRRPGRPFITILFRWGNPQVLYLRPRHTLR